jgi:serine/threonine protein kinase/tetratricopeptide (TPR) repeat protein
MTDEERVCEILARCRESSERGDAIDTDAIVRANPDIAEMLEARFEALRVLERAYPSRPESSARSSPGYDLVGRRFGAYRLLESIGAGGMGSVWRALVEEPVQGLEPGRAVALKVLHPHLCQTPGFLDRFLREAEVGKAVVHENVVRTLHADVVRVDAQEHRFLVMECVDGQTLSELLREMEKVPEELCRHIGREAAKGLAAIHAAGIIHRDVKPENVLITKTHVVKVMDLGVARFMDETVRISQAGAFVGSIQYAAPEQLGRDRAEVDARTDLHGLGLVLYELACGIHPYFADGVPQIVKRVLHEKPRRLGDVEPQISPFFEEVVHCLLEKDQDKRFASAQQVAEVLDSGEEHEWWTERSKALRISTKRPLRRIRIPRETAVYGREAEIARLYGLFEKAKAGEGQVVLIEGEAGIGKSRLVDEWVAELQQEGEDLNFLHGSYAPEGAATASGAFSTAYGKQFGEAGSFDYLKRTPLLVPAFDALVNGDATPAGAERLTTDSLQTCFVHATHGLAAERPTIVLIDDLHFAPEEGRALFASLALAAPGHRVVLVGTTRPGLSETWRSSVTRLEHCSPMELARLGPADLVRLLEDALRSQALASSLSAQISLKSDGNPFFVFEIIRGLREEQLIVQREDGSWVTTSAIGEIKVPSSVLDLVNARVASLTQEERDVVDVASCLGFEFDPLLVGDVVGMPRIPLLKLLSQIERKHRIVRSAGQRFVFDHHQVQEALYQRLPELLRQEYHSALAAAIEEREQASAKDPAALRGAVSVDLCEHLLKGVIGGRALRYLDAALTHLEKGYRSAAAVELIERALAMPDPVVGAARARLLLRLAGRLAFLGRNPDRQISLCRQAEEIARSAGDEAIRGWAANHLGDVFLRYAGDMHAAQETFSRALEFAVRLGDKSLEAAVSGNLGIVAREVNRYSEARKHYDRHLALARELGDRRGEANATGNIGILARILGRYTEAQDCYERQIALARDIGDRQSEGKGTGNLGNLFRILGRHADARELHRRHLELSQEIGFRPGEAHSAGELGNDLIALGRFAEAREQYDHCLAVARDVGDLPGEANAHGNIGRVLVSLGRFVEAREHLMREFDFARRLDDAWLEAHALHSLATLASYEGDDAAADRGSSEALASRRAIGQSDDTAETLRFRGALLARLGRTDESRAALLEVLAIARERSLPDYELFATAALARFHDGDLSAALATLAAHESGSAMDEAMEARLLLWHVTRDRSHLAEAKRRLDFLVAHAPADCRESMLANVRLYREIAAAAREAGL